MFMYIDGVILFSLLMIALILVMMGYIGWYFYRHIKIDSAKADKAIPNRRHGDKKFSQVKDAAV